jgi:hypothetical protein
MAISRKELLKELLPGLTKSSLNSAIRKLQKSIRKAAASNEYMHESVSFLEARGRRELHESISSVDATN